MQYDANKEYKHIVVDNAVCKRRFHLAFENNAAYSEHVIIKCPHCDVTLFQHENHAPTLLLREENLVKAPAGEFPTINECKF